MQRIVAMARKLPFPEGTYAVGAGHRGGWHHRLRVPLARVPAADDPCTSKAGYSAVFGLWVIVFTLTPGFFQPLEQEVGRALAHRRAQGIGGAPLVKRAATLGGILALLAIMGSIAAASPITSRVFHHESILFWSLLIGIVAYYATYIVRGTLAGNGRFGAYGTMLAAEGIVRLVATIALLVIGSRAPGAFALALVLPPIAAIAIVTARPERTCSYPGPVAPYSELSSAIGYLILGSVLCQALSYSSYITAVAVADFGAERPRQQARGGHPHRAHSDPRLPSGAGGTAPEARTLGRRGGVRRLRQGAPPARDDRARGRDHRRGRRIRRRPLRRSPAVRLEVRARQPRRRDCSRSAVAASSSPSRSPRR